MNKNIITEERLLNSYIVNDFDELRDKYVQLAETYGYKIYGKESVYWLDSRFVYISTVMNVSTSNYNLFNKGYKLTLEDFSLHEEALCAQNEPQSSVTNDTLNAHKHTLEENKRSTGAPMPLIVENGSVCDTRKDIFKEMLTFARENNAFIQFDGFTEDDNDSIIVTFVSSDDEFVVKSVDDFREILKAQYVMDKFLRG